MQKEQEIEIAKAKQEQREILKQIALKEEKKRLLLMEMQREEQELERGRRQYEGKIQDRKERGKQDLKAFKETNRLF